MCLAIAMYLVTGTLSLIWQILMALGIFLLNLLGQFILFVCASIYTVSHHHHHHLPETEANSNGATAQSFVTMYPEAYDFEDDYQTMARVSLETMTSAEESPRERKSDTGLTTTTTKRNRESVRGSRRSSRRNSQ